MILIPIKEGDPQRLLSVG